MSAPQLRAQLQAVLQNLATGDLQTSATHLLATLGYASPKTLALPHDPPAFAKEIEALTGGAKQIHPEHASLAEWQSAAFLFQLTNDELPTLAAGQMSLLTESSGIQAWQVESFVFLAIDLKPGTWSRTRLAALTREVNRLFPMPAVVLFRHTHDDDAKTLSVAVIHRRANKRDAGQDVIEGKVSIIKDIDLNRPHAAHLRILESMALGQVDAKYVPASFEALYKAWLKVLDVKALNDRFYQDLAEWYYWAIRASIGVTFPQGQPLDDTNDPATHGRPTVALIRLLTRLIFVWFLKEKRLVPPELFDEATLTKLLKTPPHLHGEQGNYYKAILQNLFFATLNTEAAPLDADGHQQRIWRADAGPKRMDKYLIHTVYRYQAEFKDADAALALLRQVPFLNGGLFECLDKLITPEDLKRDPTLAKLVVTEGRQTVLRVDGFSERPENPMHIPNELFFGEGGAEVDLNEVFGTKGRKYKPRGLLKIFDSYKFTIEENTPVEEEVALDPELLGKVFENLLASYNPDTKTTARKKSGSFYTPREVVDYMVDEALVCYLKEPLALIDKAQAAIKYVAITHPSNGLPDLNAGPGDLVLNPPEDALSVGRTSVRQAASPQTACRVETRPTGDLSAPRLRRLLSYRHTSHDFSSAEAHTLIASIERLRVLDPACGSGAFPMGMLQKLVAVLRKLDPDNALWRAQNRTPLTEQLASAKRVKDPTLRDEHSTAALAALAKFDADFADPAYADYARKLYLIEKCLYGVDIQPIAVQIAKLRFFISLVVEQNPGASAAQPHAHITPLPNLETKIVAANTLLPIPRSKTGQQDLLANPEVADKETELREANASHFAAKRFADKRRRKEKILTLRDELATLLQAELTLMPGDAQRMTAWDPFDQNRHADFFDPEWMFGFTDGFDIVIGNPPYVRQEAIKDDKPRFKPHYATYNGTADLYVYFYERAFQLLNPGGCLSFITSNKWFRAKYGANLRQYMSTHTALQHIIDFGDEAVFDALAYPTIVIATKRAQAVSGNDETNEVQVLNWDSQNPDYRVSDFPDVFATERFAVPQKELKVGGWQLEPPLKRQLLARLVKAGQPLGDYCCGRFYYGIKTGLNEAFVISREQRDALVAQDPKSAEIMKPFLRGRDVKRWNVEFSEQYIIQIESSENVTHPWSGLTTAVAETKFAETHPAIYAWFNAEGRRQQLIDRSDQGHYFWELRSCAYWDQFANEKLVFPDIALSPQFALDTHGYVLANTSYMIPKSDAIVYASVNSSVAAWFYSQISPQIQNGYYRFIAQYVGQIPIPNTSEFQRAVLSAICEILNSGIQIPEFERLLNGLVYELFFPEDLHAANIHLFDACAAAGIQSGMNAQAIAATLFKTDHPINAWLSELQTLPVVRLIEGTA